MCDIGLSTQPYRKKSHETCHEHTCFITKFSESAESMKLSKEETKTSLNNSTTSCFLTDRSLLLYTGYLRSVSSIQQRQVLEDVEQDLLRQIPPVDSLLLQIFLPPLLAGAFKSLLRPAAGATSVLLFIPLQDAFHPE